MASMKGRKTLTDEAINAAEWRGHLAGTLEALASDVKQLEDQLRDHARRDASIDSNLSSLKTTVDSMKRGMDGWTKGKVHPEQMGIRLAALEGRWAWISASAISIGAILFTIISWFVKG